MFSIIVSGSDIASKNVFQQLEWVLSSTYFEKSDFYCYIYKIGIIFILNKNRPNKTCKP